MDSVIASPRAGTFTRTSYISTPPFWRLFSPVELSRRIEQLLLADYRIRAAQLATPDDRARMVPFAFDFEWVDIDPLPAIPDFASTPLLFPAADANPRLEQIAFEELDAARRSARPGIAAGCLHEAFSLFRIDDDDSWYVVQGRDRPALIADRYA